VRNEKNSENTETKTERKKGRREETTLGKWLKSWWGWWRKRQEEIELQRQSKKTYLQKREDK